MQKMYYEFAYVCYTSIEERRVTIMANRSANVIARVEPDIKRKAEAVLKEVGMPVSTLINALYRQIIITNGVPFAITASKPIQSLNTMSREQFDSMMNESLGQVKRGEVVSLDEAFDEVDRTFNE